MNHRHHHAAVTAHEPQPCTECGGTGGTTETEIIGGAIRQSWRPCAACHGRGVR